MAPGFAPGKATTRNPPTKVKKRLRGRIKKAKASETEKKRNIKQFLNIRCPICFNYLANGGDVSSTICGHVFCTSCLQRALLLKPTCPTCRKSMKGGKSYHPLYLDNNSTKSTNDNCTDTMDITLST